MKEVIAQFVGDLEAGYDLLSKLDDEKLIVNIGSARLADTHKAWSDARYFCKQLVNYGYTPISPAGPGLMRAFNASSDQTVSIAINLKQECANEFVNNDRLIQADLFATRKHLMFTNAKALVVWPGGVGTMDELFEVMCLKQTGFLPAGLPILIMQTERAGYLIGNAIRELLYNMLQLGTIDQQDLEHLYYCESLTRGLEVIDKHCSK